MERDKALEMALGQIERQFGKGAIMRMDEESRVKIATIPTGALSLDLALGIGGLPRGRVVEIYGPESSGKCLTADTYVWTDQGLETVAELFDRCGQRASCASRTTDISALGVRAVNERGELEPVAALTHNNRRPVLRIRLASGRSVEVTHNHPLRVVNDSGFIVWRTAGRITEGDTVVSAAFGAVEAGGEGHLSEDEAVLLGYLVAEGSLSSRSAVRFTNWDLEVGAEFTKLMEGLFDANVRCYYGKEYAVHSTELRAEMAERYELDYVTAAGKKVPHCIRTGGQKAQRAFLSALFEGDGWIDPSSTIGLGTASEQLAREVQLLLYGLGIPATVASKYNPTYERDYWSVIINSAVAHRFLEEVGFRSARRQKQVAANFRAARRDPQFENIPNLEGLLRDLRDDAGGDRKFDAIAGDLFRGMNLNCSRQRLRKLVDWMEAQEPALPPTSQSLLAYLRVLAESSYTYEKVVAVEDRGPQPTFDLALPRTHSFVANGVLSHNTTVALHAIAEAQKAGGIAAFIDAEHALDPTYAQALGVDVESLLVSQPDTGEQALEITDMLIRSGAIDVVVIDSVAALTPRAEIEGEMGDSHVGLQARLMSQALRKLSGNLNRSRTCAIFINQIREKIGVLFGSPETQPGGRALKFYSSVRLDVRRIESLKDGTDAVGNRVRVKVVKNKCLAEGTQVFDPTTGLTHKIEEIVNEGVGAAVWAADKAGRLHVRPIRARLNQGQQEVIGLRLRDGTMLQVTPDHRVLTEAGWQEAGELKVGDRVARPRHAGGFGEAMPVPPDHARMVGYLIGDGYVGGKTPVAFINTQESLQQDAIAIAESLGCVARRRHKGLIYTSFSHCEGEKNGVLALARWAGIWGHLAPEKRIPEAFFAPDVSADVVGNLLFGIWESDGWISREQTGGVRCGFTTTSPMLAQQLHWLLLRWGIGSSVRSHEPGGRRSLIDGRRVVGKHTAWEVRVTGIDNVKRFAEALPMWGPRGQKLVETLADPTLAKHRGSQMGYLPSTQTEPVLAYLRDQGVTPAVAAGIVGGASDPKLGLRQVMGPSRLRRDRVEKLADALDSEFLRSALEEEVYYARIAEITPRVWAQTYDVEVEEFHNLVAQDVVVHNCAAPFKQAEFDIMFGEGISKEGSIIDVGVEQGIVKKAGAWYTYDGEQLGQGRENARQFLKEHSDVADEIYKKVTEQLGLVPTDVTGDESVGPADQ